MTAPLPNEQFDDDAEVDGYGDAPAANLTFRFKIQEHGLGPVIATSGEQVTEDTFWTFALGPPNEGTWPIGLANAVLYNGSGEVQTYVTIEFKTP